MVENVGGADRTLRFLAGPALVVLGYTVLGGRGGRPEGLLAMAAGLLTVESAITRVCPVSYALGVDTTD